MFGDTMLDKIKKISLFIIIFFTFIWKEYIFLIPLKLLSINYQYLIHDNKLLLSTLSSLELVIIIIVIYHKYLYKKIKDYKKNFAKYFDIGIKYWFIGLICMSVANLLINKLSPIHQANNEQLVQEMLKQAPILVFISATFIAPFLEEMLFRKCFGDIFKNKKIMIIMSGLLFGLLHVVFSLKTPWDLLYIIPYGALGCAFAKSLAETDNIYVPIAFHMIHNGVLTLLSILLMVIS